MSKSTCQEYENSRELFFEALRKKIRQAEDCFYKLGFNKIVPTLRQKKVSLDDAQDLLHDGIAAFYFRLDTLEVGASPTTVLYSIVHNKWVDKLRGDRLSQAN
jgi:DNA-directed RNA polymerase specialized sigma24 family protein